MNYSASVSSNGRWFPYLLENGKIALAPWPVNGTTYQVAEGAESEWMPDGSLTFLSFVVRAHLMAGDERRANVSYAELQARAETDVYQRSALAHAAGELGRIEEQADERCLGPSSTM